MTKQIGTNEWLYEFSMCVYKLWGKKIKKNCLEPICDVGLGLLLKFLLDIVLLRINLTCFCKLPAH